MWTKRNLLLRTLCTFAVTALLFEGTLRVLVYTDLEAGAKFRVPQYYADRWSDPFYFQLAQRWTHEPGDLPEQICDARLGWVNKGMDHEQFVDAHEADLAGRRPVLLFGDSYIRCMSDAENCFEGWMERSAQAQTHAIFNYGVRAYGLDQIVLLSGFALEHWRERNALVAIGIYVEDDLDRAYLDYRGWPKPRFSIDDQGALIEPGPIPSPEQYDSEHPLWKHSLAWGWLVHGAGWMPAQIQRPLAGVGRIEALKEKLAAALLERLERNLQESGFEHFYVLFPSVRECASLEPFDWQENFLINWLDAHRVPYVNVKRDLYRAALEQSRHPTEFFGFQGAFLEHLTPAGNEVAFRGLLRGIEGDFDRTNGRPTPHSTDLSDLDGPRSGRVRSEFGWTPRFPEEQDRERIILCPSKDLPARVGCEFARPALRFLATAKLVPIRLDQPSGALKLEIRVDRQSVRELVLDAASISMQLEIDLVDHASIEIIASQLDASVSPTAVLMLSSPRFQ